MKIRKIFPPHLYAAQYDKDDLDIYTLCKKQFLDFDYCESFFKQFQQKISDWTVDTYQYERDEIEQYATLVQDQTMDFATLLKDAYIELLQGRRKSIGDVWRAYDNKENGRRHKGRYLRVKCYGPDPSMIRIYALEIDDTTHIIIYGAIKIALDTKICPDRDSAGNESTIEKELEKRVKTVSSFLEAEGIVDKEGMMDYMEEEHED